MNPSLQKLLLLGILSANVAWAQTSSSTNPVCFIRVDCPANSDTRVSIPVERKPAFIGPIASVAGNVITVQGTPAWTSNQFVFAAGTQNETYYAVFLTGNRKGRWFLISANAANTLTLQLGSGDLAGVVSGDRIKILPAWTFNAAFPGGQGAIASSGPANRQTEVLLTDGANPGVNLSTVATYYFFSSAWRKLGGSADVGNDTLPPHAHFIIRNRDTATSPVFVGSLPSDFQALPLRMRAGTATQDNPVSVLRPTPISLNDSGLVESGAFRASSGPANRLDELLVFDNNAAQLNKSNSRTYYYFSNAWRRLGSSADAGADIIFEPGTGVIIRKGGNGGAADSVVFWNHEDKVYTP